MNPESPEKYRQWVATNFDSDVKEQLFDIYKEAMYENQNDAGRVAKTIAKASTLMARLSADQERLTHENLKMQAKVVKLTWALFWLTFVLTIVAAVQIYFIFTDRP